MKKQKKGLKAADEDEKIKKGLKAADEDEKIKNKK